MPQYLPVSRCLSYLIAKNTMNKAGLYYHTVRNLKRSQIFNRLRIKMGGHCSIGVKASAFVGDVRVVESPEGLDFDPVFLSRFPIDQLMNDHIEILHSGKDFDWKSGWSFDDRSDLWNYNLHYFEYLFPLIKEWKDSGNDVYLNKAIEMIKGWIDNNPEGSRPAWASYPTALRIVSWISWYGYVYRELDADFRKRFLSSLYAQYAYLADHLEKDILGNHYFEDLKSLLLSALFFRDDVMFKKVIREFTKECQEEILSDGMHFELSPMYHKIILEGLLRVVVALRSVGQKDKEIEGYIQPMLDCAYSLENGLARIPLFNDGGNNVAKSLDAIISVAADLGYYPKERACFESSGYYIFQKTVGGNTWKIIVDAGQPGPRYIPGHAHCDAMSFELFRNGEPVIVNCGTYAYQCKERSFYRSTSAHNTLMIDGTEQSQCWGAFRLAKRSEVKVLKNDSCSIMMEMSDYRGNTATRHIRFTDSAISIGDRSQGHKISSFLHLLKPVTLEGSGVKTVSEQFYAPDYGHQEMITSVEFSGQDFVDIMIGLGS